jgi:hypothetical protein
MFRGPRAGSAFGGAEFAGGCKVSSQAAGHSGVSHKGNDAQSTVPISDKSGRYRAHANAVTAASSGGNTVHESHQKAAEQHELAARAHRTAAEHNEKGDLTAADWHAERALEYSDRAYKLAQEAHTKSGKIGRL